MRFCKKSKKQHSLLYEQAKNSIRFDRVSLKQSPLPTYIDFPINQPEYDFSQAFPSFESFFEAVSFVHKVRWLYLIPRISNRIKSEFNKCKSEYERLLKHLHEQNFMLARGWGEVIKIQIELSPLRALLQRKPFKAIKFLTELSQVISKVSIQDEVSKFSQVLKKEWLEEVSKKAAERKAKAISLVDVLHHQYEKLENFSSKKPPKWTTSRDKSGACTHIFSRETCNELVVNLQCLLPPDAVRSRWVVFYYI